MCLAVPGRIESVSEPARAAGAEAEALLGRKGVVDFQGSRIGVDLTMTPGARVGDWVLVHAGFAITEIDEADALETWDYLREMGAAACPAEPGGGGG